MLLAFVTMSDGVPLTGTLGVVVLVLLLASFGATWWLAIRRTPKSRLARSSWGSLCAAMIANFTSNQWPAWRQRVGLSILFNRRL